MRYAKMTQEALAKFLRRPRTRNEILERFHVRHVTLWRHLKDLSVEEIKCKRTGKAGRPMVKLRLAP